MPFSWELKTSLSAICRSNEAGWQSRRPKLKKPFEMGHFHMVFPSLCISPSPHAKMLAHAQTHTSIKGPVWLSGLFVDQSRQVHWPHSHTRSITLCASPQSPAKSGQSARFRACLFVCAMMLSWCKVWFICLIGFLVPLPSVRIRSLAFWAASLLVLYKM